MNTKRTRFNEIREQIFEMIERSDGKNVISTVYDVFMEIVILVSLIPLAMKTEPEWLVRADKITAVIFILDYILRWATADFKFKRHEAKSFIRYPASGMALVDLLSILPSLHIIGNLFRPLRLLRLFRAAKIFRYSKSIQLIFSILRETRKSLLMVWTLALCYILISGLIIFNVEPDTFETYFDAVYWASIVLTTIGIGDIYATSTIGRVITVVSSFVGVAIVALPSGIITAAFVRRLHMEDAPEQSPVEQEQIDNDEGEQLPKPDGGCNPPEKV